MNVVEFRHKDFLQNTFKNKQNENQSFFLKGKSWTHAVLVKIKYIKQILKQYKFASLILIKHRFWTPISDFGPKMLWIDLQNCVKREETDNYAVK